MDIAHIEPATWAIILVPLIVFQTFGAVMVYLMAKWQHHDRNLVYISLIPVIGAVFFLLYGAKSTIRFLTADKRPEPQG